MQPSPIQAEQLTLVIIGGPTLAPPTNFQASISYGPSAPIGTYLTEVIFGGPALGPPAL